MVSDDDQPTLIEVSRRATLCVRSLVAAIDKLIMELYHEVPIDEASRQLYALDEMEYQISRVLVVRGLFRACHLQEVRIWRQRENKKPGLSAQPRPSLTIVDFFYRLLSTATAQWPRPRTSLPTDSASSNEDVMRDVTGSKEDVMPDVTGSDEDEDVMPDVTGSNVMPDVTSANKVRVQCPM